MAAPSLELNARLIKDINFIKNERKLELKKFRRLTVSYLIKKPIEVNRLMLSLSEIGVKKNLALIRFWSKE